ncbi:hypothetical protein ACJIZ3_021446 [Penstemon smallii]|uniref:Uncharacterized protein n=1 Tax=Penstemon smallii TaxID=265156 RepID=A0ABD3SLR4_9LAMI
MHFDNLTHTKEARRIKNGWIKTSEEEANGPTTEEEVRRFEVAMLITATKGKGLGKGLQIFLFSQLKHMESGSRSEIGLRLWIWNAICFNGHIFKFKYK